LQLAFILAVEILIEILFSAISPQERKVQIADDATDQYFTREAAGEFAYYTHCDANYKTVFVAIDLVYKVCMVISIMYSV
jgi:hypothetical protein